MYCESCTKLVLHSIPRVGSLHTYPHSHPPQHTHTHNTQHTLKLFSLNCKERNFVPVFLFLLFANFRGKGKRVYQDFEAKLLCCYVTCLSQNQVLKRVWLEMFDLYSFSEYISSKQFFFFISYYSVVL